MGIFFGEIFGNFREDFLGGSFWEECFGEFF
jgi:hypothetical protein